MVRCSSFHWSTKCSLDLFQTMLENMISSSIWCQSQYLILKGCQCSVVHVGCLQTRRLVIQSLIPPDQVLRCPWARHQTPALSDELDGALHGWHRRWCMSEWMGECEAKCKVLWWPLGLWKRYINAVHLPFWTK